MEMSHNRRHTENEMGDSLPKNMKYLDSSFAINDRQSLPGLPKIRQQLKSGVNYKRKSYSVNTLHDIIQDYEKREKIKRRYDRFILNQVKTKKRTLNASRS
jgi:hypothetical protein